LKLNRNKNASEICDNIYADQYKRLKEKYHKMKEEHKQIETLGETDQMRHLKDVEK
jgi:hypothetical protein